MYTILVVDDEKDIVSALEIYLKAEGYRVLSACNGKEALAAAAREDVHLILMDIMMPVMDGLSAMAQLRQTSNVPVILLTAKGEDTDKVLGLNVGADDYITKPFSPSELLARVDALYRRLSFSKRDEGKVYRSGPFALDLVSRTCTKDNIPIELTQVEFMLMKVFLENKNVALSRAMLLNKVWGDDSSSEEKTVDVNMRRLRMKIEDTPSEPKYITTLWGFGYKWTEE